MSIPVKCRECGERFKVKDSYAGEKIPCRECGAKVRVPSDAGPRRTPPSRNRSRSGSAKKTSKSSSGNTGLWIGLGVGLVLLIGIGVTLYLVFSKGDGEEKNNVASNGEQKQDFAPGGQKVIVPPANQQLANNNNPAAPQKQPSRFNLQNQVNQANNPNVNNGRKNSRAGEGFGNLLGVIDHWDNNFSSNSKEKELSLFRADPDVLSPENWRVNPGAPVKYGEEPEVRKKVDIKIPFGSSRSSAEDIIFPVVPSPFVALGQNATEKDTREIWDVFNNKKVDTIKKLAVKTSNNAVSPDGHYFAGVTGIVKKTIGVWDVKEGKPLVDIPLESTHGIQNLFFPRPDRLILHTDFGDQSLWVWEIPSGKLLHNITVKDWGSEAPLPAISPDGRFLVVAAKEDRQQGLLAYDLNTGNRQGELYLPDYGSSNFWLRIKGAAFSNDGKKLAAIMDGWSHSKIFIWETETGKILNHMTFETKLKESALGSNHVRAKYRPLAWFPGDQRLLVYEHAVVDNELGAIIWQAPHPKSNMHLPGTHLPVDKEELTYIKVAPNGQGYVSFYKLPADALQAARERIIQQRQQEPEIAHSVLPYKNSQVVSVENLNIITPPENTTWSVQPDPEAWPLTIDPGPLNLEVPKGSLQQFSVTGGNTPRLLILRSNANSSQNRVPWGGVSPASILAHRKAVNAKLSKSGNSNLASSSGSSSNRAWVDLYDLGKGERVFEYRLNFDGDLLSVSPDGQKFVIMPSRVDNQIVVYSTEGEGKEIANWKPYGSLGNAMLVSAAMPTPDHVVTLSGTGQLITWELPAVRPLYSVKDVSHPLFSPGGKYVGYSDGSSWQMLELRTGRVVGTIPDVGSVKASAMHPNGSQLALLAQHENGFYLFTVDIATGQVGNPFPVPVLSTHLAWYGDQYVLLDHEKLIDVNQRTVAWSYTLGNGDHFPKPLGNRHWYLSGPHAKPALHSTVLPDAQALQQLAGTQLKQEFVMQPGGSCSIRFEFQGHAVQEADRQKVFEMLKERLAANKFKIDPNAPVMLVASTSETVSADRTHKFRPIGAFAGGGVVEVPQKRTLCRFAFRVGDQIAWQRSSSRGNFAFHVPIRDRNQSIEDAVQQIYINGIKGFFRSVVLPPYVFTPTSANGLGSTDISIR